MKQILSGIQATGTPHLGNYLGALKPWVDTLEEENTQSFYMIADLHAITQKYDVEEFKSRRLNTFAALLAVGIDTSKCTLFFQSDNPNHTYLTWLLSSVSQMGELGRMIQYKEKGRDSDSSSLALFSYPVLQAADILLYDATHVPIGEDQKQHLELAKTVATRFNHYFGDTFVIPEAIFPKVGSKIKDLQNPEKKMSKSGNDTFNGVIFLTDSNDEIAKKVKKAVTDTGSEIKFADNKAGISNLLSIISGLSQKPISEIETECTEMQYGQFKQYASEVIVDNVSKIRTQIETLLEDRAQLDIYMKQGAEEAIDYSNGVVSKAKNAMGFKSAY
jgi:tryptophanyl-tRNA synthetase